MTLLLSYNYAKLKPWELYSYVPSFIMLPLIVAYEGLLEILQILKKKIKNVKFKNSKLGFQEYVLVGNLGIEDLNTNRHGYCICRPISRTGV